MKNESSTNFGSNNKHQSSTSESAKYNMDLLHISNNFNHNSNDENEERRIYDSDDCKSPRSNNDSINVIIYRYKFTDDFTNELYKFSKVHQYDHRNDFKEAWVKWSEDNSDIIINETERLLVLGYQNEDNIDDKMFKSARYYFRKKSPIKPEPKQRRQYISVDHDLLAAMDRHIANNIYNKPTKRHIIYFLNYL